MKENPSILIVDDDKATADSLTKRLKKSHSAWNIQTAYSLRQAVDFLEASQYDAVVTDYRLDDHDPDKNGLKVIDKARSKDPLCVCILMTAYPEDFDRYKDAFNKGVNECVVKSQRGLDVGKEIDFKLQLELQRRWEHEAAYYYARHIDTRLRKAWGASNTRSKLNQRLVAVMFTDVRSFSEAVQELRAHPQIVINFLEKLYSTIIEEVHKQDGIVDKFMGDGSICLFGATGVEDCSLCCKQAVLAALAIQNHWDSLVSELRRETMASRGVHLPSTVSLGIGIHIEETMVGIVQTDKGRDQFTAIGHGVNLAKKLESYAGKSVSVAVGKKEKLYTYGNILITGTVQCRIDEQFEVRREEHDLKLLKNKDPYPVWVVKKFREA